MPLYPCANCGQPVATLNDLNLCKECEAAFDEGRLNVRLRNEFGVPTHADSIVIVTTGEKLSPRAKDYYVVLFGVEAGVGVHSEPPPLFNFSAGDAVPKSTYQLLYQRMSYRGSSVFLEVRWRPDYGESIVMKGLEHAHEKSDVEKTWKGLNLLREIVKQGRPEGSMVFGKEDFLKHSIEIYREHLSKHAEHPTQLDIAAALGISKATLNRYLNSYSIPWKNIRQLAMDKE